MKKILCAVSCLVSASTYAGTSTNVPPTLETVLSDSHRAAVERKALNDIPKARLDAIKEAGLGYGVRSGLARRAYEIGQVLNENEVLLDGIFNFAAMVLEKNVLPPVLMQSENNLNQSSPDTIRVAETTYRIDRQAQFVTAPPNWRDYLIRDYRYSTEMPAASLLPRNESEKTLWQQFVSEGWKIGVQQANQIFEQSLSRLERDYKGMILYKSLLAKGMISKPYVAEANMGVTGDGNAININDRVLRITAKPQLESNPAAWKPTVAPK